MFQAYHRKNGAIRNKVGHGGLVTSNSVTLGAEQAAGTNTNNTSPMKQRNVQRNLNEKFSSTIIGGGS